MKQTLKGFVLEWGEAHPRFVFALREDAATGIPLGVEIRYPAAKYHDFLSVTNWEKMRDVVEAKTHGNMYVVTDAHLFERGIIEAKLAAMNHNFQERMVVGALRWLGEEFFPQA